MKQLQLGLSRGSLVFIAVLTVAVVVTLSLFISFSIGSVDALVTQYCFDELAEASKELASDLYSAIGTDRTILTAIATIIAQETAPSDAKLCEIINSFNLTESYLSYLELLRPDGTMLDMNGTVRDVSHAFDFAQEAEAGVYLSHISQSTLDARERVIRSAVPVLRDGETVYMLYGVVLLSDLAMRYTTTLYGGHAYVYIEDGDTGDFILNTWHKSPGNITDLGARRTLPGYSLDTAILNMRDGVGGEIGFVSKTTGSILYMRYDPLGINDWNVMVTVEQEYALQKGEAISATLYQLAAVIGAVLVFYIACVTFCLVRAYRQVRRLGTTDQTTGLLNRNAYDKYVAERQRRLLASIVCIFVDVNGLHEVNNKYGHAVGDQMLRLIADALERRFPQDFIYRIGGDEFVVFCESSGLDACAAKMRSVTIDLEAHDYHIAYGIVFYENELGVNRVIREADEQMLENKRAYYATYDRRRRP